MLSCVPAMIHSHADSSDGHKKKPLTFLTSIFKRKKDHEENTENTDATFEEGNLEHGNGNYKGLHGFADTLGQQSTCGGSNSSNFGGRVPSSLSVHAMEYMDIMVHPCSMASTLTLTPGRTRNLDRDMQALRLSRQDNPFLQVLASRESLLGDCMDENESDAAVLMSHDQTGMLDQDPLTLPEVHEHMIRSPPPTTWPRSPNSRIFRFPSPGGNSDYEDDSSQESLVGATAAARSKSPLRCCHSQPSPCKRSRSVIDASDISPSERSPEQSGIVAGNRMTGRLSLTPKAPRRCSSDTKGSGFSLLQAPKRGHHDEKELLVRDEKPSTGIEVEPDMPLVLSPSRNS